MGAGIALVSALAGIAQSAFFESRRASAARAHALVVEESKRAHEAAVRFHDERLKSYIEYMDITSKVFSVATVWLNEGGLGLFSDYASNQHNALAPYAKEFTRVTMLAKPEVAARVMDVHAFVAQLIDEPAPAEMRQIINDSLAARRAFLKAAQQELGIS